MPLQFELIAVLAVPAIVLVALRISAPMVFLSLCLGDVLVNHVAKDANSFIAFVSPQKDSVSSTAVNLAILLVPAILTSLIMLFSIKGKMKMSLNALPAAGCAVLALLLAVPLLTSGLRHDIESLAFWKQLVELQSSIIGLSAVISLVFLWLQRRQAKAGTE